MEEEIESTEETESPEVDVATDAEVVPETTITTYEQAADDSTILEWRSGDKYYRIRKEGAVYVLEHKGVKYESSEWDISSYPMGDAQLALMMKLIEVIGH